MDSGTYLLRIHGYEISVVKTDIMNKVYNSIFYSIFLTFMLLVSYDANAKGKRALLIGLSDYPVCQYDNKSSWSKIHGTNDIEIISNTLKKQGFNITKLTDSNATASKIRKSFNVLISSVQKGDIVYVHFSGHGQPVEDLSGDEDDGWDEAIVPYDAMQTFRKGKYEGMNHILDDELNKYIESLRSKAGSAGMVYFVIDACHAGSSYRSEDIEENSFVRGTMRGFSGKGKEYTPKIDKRSRLRIPQGIGKADVCVLEACRAYQANCEIKENGKFYGPLSYYINNILSKDQLGFNLDWTNKVIALMNNDHRLIRQNAIIETSK